MTPRTRTAAFAAATAIAVGTIGPSDAMPIDGRMAARITHDAGAPSVVRYYGYTYGGHHAHYGYRHYGYGRYGYARPYLGYGYARPYYRRYGYASPYYGGYTSYYGSGYSPYGSAFNSYYPYRSTYNYGIGPFGGFRWRGW
jgi:hypothetical protein